MLPLACSHTSYPGGAPPLGQVLAELSPSLRPPACSGGDPEPQLGLAEALSTLPPPTVGA